MKRTLLIATVALTGMAVLGLRSRAEQPNRVSTFMKAKLTHSKNVLEGLATEDYKLLAKNSQELALLSQASTWKVLQTEDYLRYSNEFRRSANAIRKAAEEENLDGATLAYVQMTMNCVKCHKYLRKVRK